MVHSEAGPDLLPGDDEEFRHIGSKIVAWFDGVEARHGRLKLSIYIGLICFAISMSLAFPMQIGNALLGRYHLSELDDRTVNPRYVLCYLPQVVNPWHPEVPGDYVQFRHRILAPVIAHYLGIRGNLSVLIPFLANPVLLCLAFLTMRKRSSVVVAAMITLLLSVTLVTVTGQTWAGFQDSLANLFLLAAMFAYGPIVSAVLVLIGMFADERILAAVPLVLIWHATDARTVSWFKDGLIRCVAFGTIFVLWVGYYLILKKAQHVSLDAVTQSAYGSPARYISAVLPAIYYGLRAGWVFPILAVILAGMRKQWSRGLVLLAATMPIVLISLTVGDISRVCAIAFPAVLIGVDWSARNLRREITAIVAVLTLANLTSPIISITGGFDRYFSPAPLAILQMMQKK